jgi:hypothetical protein
MDRATDPELPTIHFFMAAHDGRILDLSKGETAHPRKVRHSSIRLNSTPGAIFDIVKRQ